MGKEYRGPDKVGVEGVLAELEKETAEIRSKKMLTEMLGLPVTASEVEIKAAFDREMLEKKA
jgi:hypothetical protein